MMNDKKSPVQKFLEGKGFYLSLIHIYMGQNRKFW